MAGEDLRQHGNRVGEQLMADVTYIGETDFVDQSTRAPNKNEYGMDVLIRRMKGAAPRLVEFVGGLRQGQTHAVGGATFYLQSWSVDENPIYPTVTMVYKGLIAGIPDPIGEDSYGLRTASMSTDSPEKASRDIQYYAFQTTWRYVRNYRPISAQIGNTSAMISPRIIYSVITDKDGKRYPGNAPIGLVGALTPPSGNRLVSMNVTPVVGSPFFECEETIENAYLT